MKQILTTGIILSRTDYVEADRILTILTPDHGKLRLMARGVRKIKSKLAGGIELFSVSHITYIAGKGEIGTLVSTRLIKHYGHIVSDIERVQLGYELIALLNRVTEDHPDATYYELLEQTFAVLDEPSVDRTLINVWFQAQLLRLGGHTPNLQAAEAEHYTFDLESMAFSPGPSGRFTVNDVKFLRLLFGDNRPAALARVENYSGFAGMAQPLVRTMMQNHLHV